MFGLDGTSCVCYAQRFVFMSQPLDDRLETYRSIVRAGSLFALAVALVMSPQTSVAQGGGSQSGPADCEVKAADQAPEVTVTCPAVTGGVERHPSHRLYMLRVRLQQEKGRNWLLVITSSSAWNFLRVDSARAVIDDEAYSVAFHAVDARKVEGGVVEQHALQLTRDQLRALADASSFNLQVAESQLRLPVEALAEHASALLDE